MQGKSHPASPHLECLIVQPIDQIGHELLREAGIMPRMARSADMSDIAAEIENATAVVTRNAGLSTAAILAARNLKVIAVQGIGVDPVDVSMATQRGIPVINTPFANVQSVAEHAIALLLALRPRRSPRPTGQRDGAMQPTVIAFPSSSSPERCSA